MAAIEPCLVIRLAVPRRITGRITRKSMYTCTVLYVRHFYDYEILSIIHQVQNAVPLAKISLGFFLVLILSNPERGAMRTKRTFDHIIDHDCSVGTPSLGTQHRD